MDKLNLKNILTILLTVLLVGYASKLIQIDVVEKAFRNNIFRVLAVITIILLFQRQMSGASLLLLIIYCLEVSKTPEGFAPFSKDYKITNTQTLIEPNNQIYPGCMKITAQQLLNQFNGDKKALQDKVLYGYSQLLKQIPDSDSSKETLEIMARAVGLPYNVDLSDDTAPLIATMLIVQGFKLSDTCQQPDGNIQNADLQLLSGSTVAPMDTGDFSRIPF